MAGDARTGLVRILKVALPLTAMGLIAAVFLSPRPEVGRGVGFSGFEYDAADGLRLADPRFSGRLADGRAFSVLADWALPDGPDPERVDLGPLTATFEAAADLRLSLTAAGGRILPRADRLSLDGPVRLETSQGHAMTAAAAEVDVAAQTLEATGPVAGAGPMGEIEAGAMRAARRGETHYIWFDQGVRLRLDPTARAETD